MRQKRFHAWAVAGLMAALMVVSAAVPAQAKPIERGKFHDSFSEVFEECGLTLRHDVEVDGTFLINQHGPDGFPYFSSQAHGTVVHTNLATGKSLTEVFNVNDKDQKITDNGDGTLTILILATGSFKVYGPDGEFLFADPGQTRFAFLVDHAGTPTDPSDDVFLEDLGIVKGSTGRNDLEGRDFCADVQEFTA